MYIRNRPNKHDDILELTDLTQHRRLLSGIVCTWINRVLELRSRHDISSSTLPQIVRINLSKDSNFNFLALLSGRQMEFSFSGLFVEFNEQELKRILPSLKGRKMQCQKF